MSEQCKTEETCTCATRPSTEDCCDMPENLLSLANLACREVLKEKIKAEIVKSCGDSMDKIAKLVAEANKAKWTHSIQEKASTEEYKRALKELMVECHKD